MPRFELYIIYVERTTLEEVPMNRAFGIVIVVAALSFACWGVARADWERTYGGSFSDGFNSVASFSDGSFVAAGYIAADSISFGSCSAYLARFSVFGRLLWSARSVSNAAVNYSVAVDSLDNIIVAGNILTSDETWRGILVKLSSNGDTIWENRNLTPPFPVPYIYSFLDNWYLEVIIDNSGGYLFVLGAEGKTLIHKLNSAGDTLWTKEYGGATVDDEVILGSPLLLDDGGYLLSGFSNHSFVIYKLTADGDSLWARSYWSGLSLRGFKVQNALPCNENGYLFLLPLGGGYETLVRIDTLGDTLWTKASVQYGYPHPMRIFGDAGYIIPDENRILLIDTLGDSIGFIGNTPANSSLYAVTQLRSECVFVGAVFDDYDFENYYINQVSLYKPPPATVRAFGGTNWDFATRILPTDDGGFVVGGTYGSIPWSGAPGQSFIFGVAPWGDTLWSRFSIIDTMPPYSELEDVCLTGEGGLILLSSKSTAMKIDSAFSIVWHNNYHYYTPSRDWQDERFILPLLDGTSLLGGYSEELTSGGPPPSYHPYSRFIRINADGDTLWMREFTGSPVEAACRTTDNAVLAARQDGIFKISEDGDSLWSRTMRWCSFGSIIPTRDGNYLAAGTIYYSISYSRFNYLYKINEHGDSLNAVVLDSLADHYSPTQKVVQTSDGGFLFVTSTFTPTGYFLDELDTNISVTKLDESLNFVFSTTIGGPTGEMVEDVAVGTTGSILIAGRVYQPSPRRDCDLLLIRFRDALDVQETTPAQATGSGIAVYPNPFNYRVRINAPQSSTIKVYDLLGHLYEELPPYAREWVPKPPTPTGTYLISCQSRNSQQTTRVVYLKTN